MWYWIETSEERYVAQLEVCENIFYHMVFMKQPSGLWEIDYWPIAIAVNSETQKIIDDFTSITPTYNWGFNVLTLYRLMTQTIQDFVEQNNPKGITVFTQTHREPQKKLHELLYRFFDKKYKLTTTKEIMIDDKAGEIERLTCVLQS